VRIYKYKLGFPEAYQEIAVHGRPIVLRLAVQGGGPCLWIDGDDSAAPTTLEVYTVETGSVIRDHVPRGARYVGSYDVFGGSYVGHVYVVGEELKTPEPMKAGGV